MDNAFEKQFFKKYANKLTELKNCQKKCITQNIFLNITPIRKKCGK